MNTICDWEIMVIGISILKRHTAVMVSSCLLMAALKNYRLSSNKDEKKKKKIVMMDDNETDLELTGISILLI